jgi:sulfur-oxidizing protein SoxX
MKKTFFTISSALVVSSVLSTTVVAKEMSGKEIAFDRKLGNCLACHMVAGGELPGNIAPPLIAMKARFPDKAKLRAQIADATIANPNSIMIPFERHGILTSEQVDKVTDFIHSL